MTDTYTHPGVRQSWKSLRDPKTLSNSSQNGPESAKMASVDDRHVNAPRGSSIVEITPGPQKVNNSPQNEPESAKTASVDDRQVNTPRGSSIVEITPGPQNTE